MELYGNLMFATNHKKTHRKTQTSLVWSANNMAAERKVDADHVPEHKVQSVVRSRWFKDDFYISNDRQTKVP